MKPDPLLMRNPTIWTLLVLLAGAPGAVRAAQVDQDAARSAAVQEARGGDPQRAEALLRDWLGSHPDDLEAGAALGIALFRQGRTEECFAQFDTLPTDPGLLTLRAELEVAVGYWERAIETLSALPDPPPPRVDAVARRLLARALLETGRPAKAIELLADRTGRDPEAAVVLGRAYYLVGRPRDAIDVLQPFVEQLPSALPPALPPDQVEMLEQMALTHGSALLAVGRADEAVTALQRLTELLPRRQPGWALLAQALVAAGHPDAAQEALDRGKRIGTGAH